MKTTAANNKTQKPNKLTILADSICDLPQEVADELGIKIVPLSVMVGERNYTGIDGDCVSAKTVYDAMRKGQKTSTGQVPPILFREFFLKELERGNDVLQITVSSALSGSYQSAVSVQNQLAEKFPGNRIYVVDSMSACLGEGLVAYKTAKFYEKCGDAQKTFEYAQNLVKTVCAMFTVEDLKYLRAGGRVSAAKAIIGTLLNMKPVLHVSADGKLVPFAKVMGRKKSLGALLSSLAETMVPGKNDVIMIGHGDCLDEAKILGQTITEKTGISNIIYSFIGPVVGAHSGPGTIALFFEGENKGIKK